MEVEAIRYFNGVKVVIKSDDRELFPDITPKKLNKIRNMIYPPYDYSDDFVKNWIIETYLDELEEEEADDWDE